MLLVLGSSLGGLVAATYLRSAGCAPPLIEETPRRSARPFCASRSRCQGLETEGPGHRVLRELALPLIEQRRVAQRSVALQVLLPDARIDVHAGRRELARELAAPSTCASPGAAQAFFEAADDARGDELRARLVEGDAGDASAPLWCSGCSRARGRNGSADPSLGAVPDGLGPRWRRCSPRSHGSPGERRRAATRDAPARHPRRRLLHARRGLALPRSVPPGAS